MVPADLGHLAEKQMLKSLIVHVLKNHDEARSTGRAARVMAANRSVSEVRAALGVMYAAQ